MRVSVNAHNLNQMMDSYDIHIHGLWGIWTLQSYYWCAGEMSTMKPIT